MMVRKYGRESGFSMIEVLVAMAILGFVTMAFVGSQYVAIKGNELSLKRISAESLARSELEFVKASPFEDAWWSYTLPGAPPSWAPNHNSLPVGYTDYSITVTADTLSGYDSKIQKLTAVVSYKGSQVMTVVAYRAD